MQPLSSTAPSSVLNTTLSQQGLFGIGFFEMPFELYLFMGPPARVARVLVRIPDIRATHDTIPSSNCDLGSLNRRSQVPVTLALLGLNIWLYLLERRSLRPNNISPLLENIATNPQRCRKQPERSRRCRRKISP